MDFHSRDLVKKLYYASCMGRDSEVLSLLKRGADPNSYYQGDTSLIMACWNNHPLTTQLLIKWGASLTMTSQYSMTEKSSGWTALHWACNYNSMDCVKVLMDHHSPTDIKDRRGRAAIDIARQEGHHKLVTFLTEFQLLPRDPLSSYPSVKQLSQLQIDQWSKLGLHLGLTEYEVGSMNKHKNPKAAMFLAAKVQNTELKWKHIVEELVEIGEGWAALPVSARYGWLDLFKCLVESVGLNPSDSGDNHSRNLLHLACSNGHLQFVKYLITKKICDGMYVKREGQAALPVCARHGWLDLFKYLVESMGITPSDSVENPDRNLFHLACSNGDLQFVKYLITKELCDGVCVTREGQAALPMCIRLGWLDLLKYLVESVGITPGGEECMLVTSSLLNFISERLVCLY